MEIEVSSATMVLAILGLAVGVLAIGLFIGNILNGTGGNTSYRTGYSIERDDRGRVTGIIPLPFS